MSAEISSVKSPKFISTDNASASLYDVSSWRGIVSKFSIMMENGVKISFEGSPSNGATEIDSLFRRIDLEKMNHVAINIGCEKL